MVNAQGRGNLALLALFEYWRCNSAEGRKESI